MKYELLKRTAIALFVGGVISTYVMLWQKINLLRLLEIRL